MKIYFSMNLVMKDDKRKYIVVGTFWRSRNDQEGEARLCENYAAALQLREEWKKSNKYKKIVIAKKEE